jgi:hypothetical protein
MADYCRSIRITNFINIIAMAAIAFVVAEIGPQTQHGYICLAVVLFVVFPSYLTCMSSGISKLFGNYCGGQCFALMSSAKALGAAASGLPMLLLT